MCSLECDLIAFNYAYHHFAKANVMLPVVGTKKETREIACFLFWCTIDNVS